MLSLTEACKTGYHWCRDCERVSEPKSTETHYQICVLCGSYNNLIWCPPVGGFETRKEQNDHN